MSKSNEAFMEQSSKLMLDREERAAKERDRERKAELDRDERVAKERALDRQHELAMLETRAAAGGGGGGGGGGDIGAGFAQLAALMKEGQDKTFGACTCARAAVLCAL